MLLGVHVWHHEKDLAWISLKKELDQKRAEIKLYDQLYLQWVKTRDAWKALSGVDVKQAAEQTCTNIGEFHTLMHKQTAWKAVSGNPDGRNKCISHDEYHGLEVYQLFCDMSAEKDARLQWTITPDDDGFAIVGQAMIDLLDFTMMQGYTKEKLLAHLGENAAKYEGVFNHCQLWVPLAGIDPVTQKPTNELTQITWREYYALTGKAVTHSSFERYVLKSVDGCLPEPYELVGVERTDDALEKKFASVCRHYIVNPVALLRPFG